MLIRLARCIEHSRIESSEERINVLVFAHGPLLVYALAAHGITFFYSFNARTLTHDHGSSIPPSMPPHRDAECQKEIESKTEEIRQKLPVAVVTENSSRIAHSAFSTQSSNVQSFTPSPTVNRWLVNVISAYSSLAAALAFLCQGPSPPSLASSLLLHKPATR